MIVVAVLCLLAATALQVYALPNGAPIGACADIQPMGPHIGNDPLNSANMSNIPFQLDLSQFRCPSGVAGYCYVPGATYQLTLSGVGSQQFRGLLVQGRQYFDMTQPVGTFTGFTANTRASACTPAEVPIKKNLKPTVHLPLVLLVFTDRVNKSGHITRSMQGMFGASVSELYLLIKINH